MATAKNKWNLGEERRSIGNGRQERAVLIGVVQAPYTEEKIVEYMDELEFLAQTAGAETVKRFIQKMSKPDSKTFIGSGKVEEIKNYIETHDIELAIFD